MSGGVRYGGRCLACGDEWVEQSAPAICPECHSLDVVRTFAETQDEPEARRLLSALLPREESDE